MPEECKQVANDRTLPHTQEAEDDDFVCINETVVIRSWGAKPRSNPNSLALANNLLRASITNTNNIGESVLP